MNTHHELHHRPRPGLAVTTLLLVCIACMLSLAAKAGEQVVYDADTETITARFPDGYFIDGVQGTAQPPHHVLDVIREDRPEAGTDYDASTHYVRRLDPVADTAAGTLTYGWQIIAYTAEELAEINATYTPIEVVMARLTDAEFEALTDPDAATAVKRFVKLAEYRGGITSNSPDLASGAAALDALGIIAASRWADILAP